MEKLSVAIPANREDAKFVFALQSALCQNPEITDVVITDNNQRRKNGLAELAKSHQNLSYYKNEVGSDALSNFISSWEASRTRYFTWLGDDDFIVPGFTEKILEEIHDSCQGVVAWAGLPSIYESGGGMKVAGNFHPNISGKNAYTRLIRCHRFGKYNFPIYSVVDKEKVSIDPCLAIRNWPAPIEFDWAWSYYLSVLGEVRMTPRQLYIYCIDNWVSKENKPDLAQPYRKLFESSDPCEYKCSRMGSSDTLAFIIHVNRLLLAFIFVLFAFERVASSLSEERIQRYMKTRLEKCFWFLWDELLCKHECYNEEVMPILSGAASISDILQNMAFRIDFYLGLDRATERVLKEIIANFEGLVTQGALREKVKLDRFSVTLRLLESRAVSGMMPFMTVLMQPQRIRFC